MYNHVLVKTIFTVRLFLKSILQYMYSVDLVCQELRNERVCEDTANFCDTHSCPTRSWT